MKRLLIWKLICCFLCWVMEVMSGLLIFMGWFCVWFFSWFIVFFISEWWVMRFWFGCLILIMLWCFCCICFSYFFLMLRICYWIVCVGICIFVIIVVLRINWIGCFWMYFFRLLLVVDRLIFFLVSCLKKLDCYFIGLLLKL